MIIDANIFLEVLLEQKNSEKCKSLLREILNGEKQAFISTITIDSIVLVMIKYKIQKEKIELFLKSLVKYKGLRFYQIKLQDRIKAIYLMDKYKLDYEDSLVLQSAFSTQSKEIISLDKHFDKIKEIKRID